MKKLPKILMTPLFSNEYWKEILKDKKDHQDDKWHRVTTIMWAKVDNGELILDSVGTWKDRILTVKEQKAVDKGISYAETHMMLDN